MGSYEYSQFDRLGGDDATDVRVKFTSETGETKWLSLSSEAYYAVRNAILANTDEEPTTRVWADRLGTWFCRVGGTNRGAAWGIAREAIQKEISARTQRETSVALAFIGGDDDGYMFAESTRIER